ncbi:hypothetical protein [Petrachloros mirabilis]
MAIPAADYGTLAVVLGMFSAFAGGVWKLTAYILKRLFDEKDGLITNYYRRHEEFLGKQEEFMTGLSLRDEQQVDLCAGHAKSMEGATQDISAIKAAGRRACGICRRVLDNPPDGVIQELEELEKTLQ